MRPLSGLCALYAVTLVACHGPSRTEAVASSSAVAAPDLQAALIALDRALPAVNERRRLRDATPAPAQGEARPSVPFGSPASAESGHVALRFGGVTAFVPRDEAPLLEPYLGPLLGRAEGVLSARYRAAPSTGIRVEFWPGRDALHARAGARRRFVDEGMYAGGVVLLLSPSGGAENWAETLQHELAHAFQAGDARPALPLHVAEGLAELDVRALDAAYARGLDAELRAEVEAAPTELLARVDATFRDPPSASSLALAYHAAAEWMAHVERVHGAVAISRLLAALRAGAQTEAAYRMALGEPLGPALEAFAAVVRRSPPSMMVDLAAEAERGPGGGDAAAEAARDAARALVAGRHAQARAMAERVLAGAPTQRVARHVRMRAAVALRDPLALTFLRELVRDGDDSVTARVALGQAYFALGSLDAAAMELEAAQRLDRERPEVWDLALRLADAGAHGADRAHALARLAEFDRRSSSVTRQAASAAIARGDWLTARRLGERLVFIAPMDPEAHALLGSAYAGLGDTQRAARERALRDRAATRAGDAPSNRGDAAPGPTR